MRIFCGMVPTPYDLNLTGAPVQLCEKSVQSQLEAALLEIGAAWPRGKELSGLLQSDT
jgi:hypothetical protein